MTTIGKQIFHLDCVDSTNNFAAKLINDQICQDGSVIMADKQTAGKGQMGNTWESEHALNLLCSIAWRPDNLSVQDQSQINWMICASLHKLLLRFGIDAKIKWPNDVYVHGKKIAGVLIENQIEGKRISWTIAGIGLNVNQQSFENSNATSLSLEIQTQIHIKTVLNELIDIMNGYLHQWKIMAPQLKSEVETQLYQKGQLERYADANGEFDGVILGVQDDGRLVISVQGESRVYSLKEVQFL
ncbi:MAG: biotin--[acetyl-CoA-carboxylase] ligase [Flavobacteriales bacterium]